jgi:hypothetical protein
MRTDIDYRKLDHRWEGFDWYYKFTTQMEDSTADLVCENYVGNVLYQFDIEERSTLAFWFGAIGSPSSMIFTKKFGNFKAIQYQEIMEFFEKNKKRISFASDAKYRKIHFEPFISSVCNSLGSISIYQYIANKVIQRTSGLSDMPYVIYDALSEDCKRDWDQWGRMGHWCFSEALNMYTSFPVKPRTMEFGATGKSHTAGWVMANEKAWFESDHVEINDEVISKFEIDAKRYITDTAESKYSDYKNINFYTLETACCNYKRQHKGSRYAGCYIDELYDDIMILKENWPEYEDMANDYLTARIKNLPHSLLYERSADFDPNKPAYQKSWHQAFMEHGRMPRVEAWANNQKQRWCDIHDLNYESNLEDMWT